MAGVPDRLHRNPVWLVMACPDEPVGADAERVLQVLEGMGVGGDKLFHGSPRLLGGKHVLETVLVSVGLQTDDASAARTMSGNDVGLDKLKREPDMGSGVDVGNGSRDVDAVGHVRSPFI